MGVNRQDVGKVGPGGRQREHHRRPRTGGSERRGGVARSCEVVGEDRQSRRQRVSQPRSSNVSGRGGPSTSTWGALASSSKVALDSTNAGSHVVFIRATRALGGFGLP